jgi:hypothetical protein
MNDIIGYIFGSLKSCEDSMEAIKQSLRNQIRINQRVSLFTAIAAVSIVALEIREIERDKKIRQLKKEVEELKQTKGE